MKKIENLEELQHLVGIETVEKCVMEYWMLLVAKAKQVERIAELWEQVETSYHNVGTCPKKEELQEFYDTIGHLLQQYEQKERRRNDGLW